ncbi:MAG: glucose-1-phosphate cytidylyltransferase [Candidatus Pacebacteria bacterium]|nr:glucose-1-phosphate cytidylyltransferase [Candidatus Paceibacterota bacterium]
MSKQPQTHQVPVVILCGGRGTRIKEETDVVPKPLVTIGSYPILWHIMKLYGAFGHDRFVLPVGYKGERIKEYFTRYPSLQGDFTIDYGDSTPSLVPHKLISENWRITVIDTGVDTEGAARVKRVQDFIEGPTFMLTYGDGVANVDIEALLRFHTEQGKLATVTGVFPPARFGAIVADGSLVSSFKEKHQLHSELINGGFFVMQKEVLSLFPEHATLNLERDILPKLAEMGQLALYRHEGYWQCMDTIRDRELLEELWGANKAPWKIW